MLSELAREQAGDSAITIHWGLTAQRLRLSISAFVGICFAANTSLAVAGSSRLRPLGNLHTSQRPHGTHNATCLPVLCFLPCLTLLLTIPYSQLLQQHRPVVECLAVSATHVAAFLEEDRDSMRRGPFATCAGRRFDSWMVFGDFAELFREVGLVEYCV